MAGTPFAFGCLRRREVILPTWRGWTAMALLLSAATWAWLASVHPFLALHAPVGGEALVVEGWIPDYALRDALREFRARGYPILITTGGPIPEGTAISYQGNYAQLAAATLREFGLPADSIIAVPAPWVRKDRTYAEGAALAEWMRGQGRILHSLDVYSFSAHARRSRLLYSLALGPRTRVGVLSGRDRDYDPERWWAASSGFRSVTDEWIAYLYAKFAFRE